MIDLSTGVHFYHEKGSGQSDDSYLEYRKQWAESRDITWLLKNQRKEKIRDHLKESLELMANYQPIHIYWRSDILIQVVLSNGIIISFLTAQHCPDVEQILMDKTLVSKLHGDQISDACIGNDHLLILHADKSKITLVLHKSTNDIKKLEKLSTFDPKFQFLSQDYHQVKSTGTKPRLSINVTKDRFIIWWPFHDYGNVSRVPASYDDKTYPDNIVIGSIARSPQPHIQIVRSIRTTGNPLTASFSAIKFDQFITMETTTNENIIERCVYDLAKDAKSGSTSTEITVPSSVTCCQTNQAEDKFIIGCDDGTIICCDDNCDSKSATKSSVVHPMTIQWHWDDTIFIVANDAGEFQMFDIALSEFPIHISTEQPTKFSHIDLAKYLQPPIHLLSVAWSPDTLNENESSKSYADIAFVLSKGPIAILRLEIGIFNQGRLGPIEITNEYLKQNQYEEAVSILSNLDWNKESQVCYSCLMAICDEIFKNDLNEDNELLIDSAIGTFYNPKQALHEKIAKDFKYVIEGLLQRLFDGFIRRKSFEKAFYVADRLENRELFMDLYYVAMDYNELTLAYAAKARADKINTKVMHYVSTDNADAVTEDISQNFKLLDTEAKRLRDDETPDPLMSSASHIVHFGIS